MFRLVRHAIIPVAATVIASAWAVPARAHIDMVGALMSRGGDQKSSPCDGAKGDGPVYTFQPGATITLALDESIPHPSYFRISFDNDGDDGFVEPKSIKPIDPNRGCPYNADDQCGESDFCNVVSASEATVLWDNLNPHMAADAKSMSWTIKLPDIECESCTIQVLQIMEDTLGHGAYCPQGSCANSAASAEDIYHRCVDITLKRDATNSPGTTTEPVMNQGMECVAPAGTGAAGAAGGAAGSAGAAAGASGGTGSASAGSSGSTGTAGAAAGAPAPTGIAGSSSSSGAPSKPAMSASAGSLATPAAAAGSPASGSAGTGTTAGGATQAGAASTAPVAAPAADSGCSVSDVRGTSTPTAALGWLASFGIIAATRRRRRRAR